VVLASAARSALRHLPGARRAALVARFGDVGRTSSLTEWGEERGTPVDRWYVTSYLRRYADDVRGRVLEVKNDHYGSWLGASTVEVVDIDPTNRKATVVGDLCAAGTLEPGRYDAAVVTQTLQFVSDPGAAVRNLLGSLRPGGVLLITAPCLSRLCGDADLWRWTPTGFRHMLADAVGPGAAVDDVSGLGNGLAARAFLFGLAVEDLRPEALHVQDAQQPLLVGARLSVAS
jgi:SAM-dependent methyltransferase